MSVAALKFDPVERANLTLSAGAVAAAFAFASPGFAVGVAIGAAIEALNFRGLRRQAQLLFWGEIAGGRGWTGLYALRFLLLLTGIGGSLAFGAHPVGLLVGLSLVMPAAILHAIWTRPPVDPSAPALDPEDPSWERWDPWLARERDPRDDEEDDEG